MFIPEGCTFKMDKIINAWKVLEWTISQHIEYFNIKEFTKLWIKTGKQPTKPLVEEEWALSL